MEEQQVEQRQEVKNVDTKVRVLMVVIAVGVIAAGICGYLWFQQSKEVDRLQTSLDTSNRQLAALGVASDEASPGTDGDTTAPTPAEQPPTVADDNKAIIDGVAAYAHAKVGAEHAVLSIQITKKESPFARVAVNGEEDGFGYACVLKQVDGLWVVLFCGQSAPLQSELDQWGVPASIL